MKLLFRTLMAIVISATMFTAAHGDEKDTLNDAVDWLVAQQDESGAFKSKHYGAMKQGAAMTSLVLYALSKTPEESQNRHPDSIEKAFDFLMPGTQTRKRVANPDGSLDHPVYCTALFLIAAKRLNRELDAELVDALLDFLIRSQCVESRGFEPANPNYGGWDVIGPDVMAGKTSGTNVSMASFVLEAFACYVPVQPEPNSSLDNMTVERVRESRQRAIDWLQRLHATGDDGGFHFSAQPGSALNKSTTEDGKPNAYASATCDGLLALHFAGQSDSEAFKSALKWIELNARANEVAGFDKTENGGWPKALRFYHWQSLARVVKACNSDASVVDVQWQRSLADEVLLSVAADAQDNGRFQNESSLMRENDPLIATSFAIVALASLTANGQ
ncbi:prenyltransferase/squalene oxidase repeat-containing protein [Mariniblastus fucicola]|uniref:Uncharacterized protein n=1 Tax=Mariniblastus fucicola TaxID=980251 RepID=A0A5B9P8Z1_9BACT|nr:prenyltransferase/squalene oxidase repeat-containing protein [Mariniblastus fucicola]QEG21360.1 hypothetical protein MFFC18_12160 [Mariniblastus fucicola]